MTRVIVATMIEQRDGDVDAPAIRKNLSLDWFENIKNACLCLRHIRDQSSMVPYHCTCISGSSLLSLDTEEDEG